MKYLVRVTETLAKSVIVEANSKEEAENKVDQAYDDAQIVLDYDDFNEYEIEALREATKEDFHDEYCDLLEKSIDEYQVEIMTYKKILKLFEI